jgi:hypothetical protein
MTAERKQGVPYARSAVIDRRYNFSNNINIQIAPTLAKAASGVIFPGK